MQSSSLYICVYLAYGDEVGIKRFAWVTSHLQKGDRLARSGAPDFGGEDTDQYLSGRGLQFLKSQGITYVISVNSAAKSKTMERALAKGGIAYTPLPVKDRGAPSLGDYEKGWNEFKAHRTGATLVWCGFGHGRTGAMITALQMFAEHEGPRPHLFSHADFQANIVENDGQRNSLLALQEMLLERRPK